ncbi:hypothetical protein [Adhaeribacter aquaticus]|uniref:hypothetical protein n=1 Tax=Adhaeribacter aquaticus TaxID=299567 RepID=UPI000401AEF4|nr:hypothetical protein [Adhaeribacter aquaticus]
MKLKIFDLNNSPSGRNGRAFIHLTNKGIFTINVPAAQALKLSNDDKVKLAQDEENPSDWCLILAPKDVAAFPVRKKGLGSYVFNNTGVAKLIYESLKAGDKALRIPLTEQPEEVEGVKLYPLVTKAALKK